MFLERSKIVRTITTSALVATFAIPPSLVAETADHLVSPSELQKATVEASQKREKNLESLRSFLSSDSAVDEKKTGLQRDVSCSTELAAAYTVRVARSLSSVASRKSSAPRTVDTISEATRSASLSGAPDLRATSRMKGSQGRAPLSRNPGNRCGCCNESA